MYFAQISCIFQYLYVTLTQRKIKSPKGPEVLKSECGIEPAVARKQ